MNENIDVYCVVKHLTQTQERSTTAVTQKSRDIYIYLTVAAMLSVNNSIFYRPKDKVVHTTMPASTSTSLVETAWLC